jgi:hypothetical protein
VRAVSEKTEREVHEDGEEEAKGTEDHDKIRGRKRKQILLTDMKYRTSTVHFVWTRSCFLVGEKPCKYESLKIRSTSHVR